MGAMKLEVKSDFGCSMSEAISQGLQNAIGKDHKEAVAAILTEVQACVARRCLTEDSKLGMAYRVLFFKIFGH